MRWFFLIGLFVSTFFGFSQSYAFENVKGFNLTEIGTFVYDAAEEGSGAPKTEPQKIIDALYEKGVRHVVLNPRAVMRDPRGTEITPVTPAADRALERQRYARFVKYLKSKGMTVGIRPIFFVVNAEGKPYLEPQANGAPAKLWWHGNIQPADPDKWFESFRTYLDAYLLIAKATKAEEFTIGAELYSMTVGIEDQWRKHPYGFPGRWLELLRYVKGRLGPDVRVMYDVNFTDDNPQNGNLSASGGEFERWRYRLVDLADPADVNQKKIWQDLVNFWKELDAIGIDMYRSLASKSFVAPADYNALVGELQTTADRYATQIDNTLAEIDLTLNHDTQIIFKEIGYKSVDNAFLDPFAWDESSPNVKLNVNHQAASYEAIFRAFWVPGWKWHKGIVFWDASMDPARHGPQNKGFSPLGKNQTENILRQYFQAGAL
jgi:hypothetical protein